MVFNGTSDFDESCSKIICTPLRTIVSQNRRRYQHDGFNLDLTYITDRIIAMGYPADTTERLYRNSMSHIVKFLEHYHPGHYKVFNLRGQYVYNPSKFHNRVVSFEMSDHHPPRLELMAPFCREVHEYLEEDPKNVVAVHCKAGKGRTGVMICAYLCYINFFSTPRQNMDYYSIVRTHNNKGVTIPSQRRYVYYFQHLREKQLNYIPLKTELVGIYVERPPKISTNFSKGALKIRVANGDVDVFSGDDLWITKEMFEEEELSHKKFPVMAGDDHFNPNDPMGSGSCISRRCYGWTVPRDKRVFLEGDVRVDLYHKSQIKVVNLGQDRKKIGHVWFNTMFTCPGFAGGLYVHGDEKYLYKDGASGIVRRKRKEEATETTNGSNAASLPASPSACASRTNGVTAISPLALQDDVAKKKNRLPIKLTRRNRSPSNNESSESLAARLASASLPIFRNVPRQSVDSIQSADAGALDDFEVLQPPGLEQHCPFESLQSLHPFEKHAPRVDIEEMLKDACRRNLISDSYNSRRLSVAKDGALMPHCDVKERPKVGGPFCLMREPREHVQVYGTLEVDRAYKNKEMDVEFKVIIVTRCVDESQPFEVQLAQQFVKVTREKQLKKDQTRNEKLQHNRQKYESTSDVSSASTQTLPSTGSDSEPEGMSGNLATVDSTAGSTHFIPEDLNPLADARKHDAYLCKYFFRQRVTSQSRHPSVHYHCPLLQSDPQICQRYGCRKRALLKTSERLEEEAEESETSSTHNDDTSSTESYPRSSTITIPRYAQCERGNEVAVIDSQYELIPRTISEAAKKASQLSQSSRELIEQIERGDFHPSDSNWASSSTSSSCQSLTEE
ncbi:Phosphatidylinositol 3,4,5-trisphosphate 3-phosphatase and dual-specificity protein phosphatase PTEN [Aphelenchoides besseyi]|nr:Phosphatidylinositol 3,4,5-trisphosphate 3-phosphatase and dual-specificity protein phosphatase PTEN [Aphelenchoides besseyi]KAI6211708.1 Phosphatidylinositol 3,4,5-trisphosphate 3-phosphatase and dual-specificity protein phosphatase PTEN [Aphelenchoides besseyi]